MRYVERNVIQTAFKNVALFCKVFHLQTIVDNIALNVHTMFKKSQKCSEQCWKLCSTICCSLCSTKKVYNVVPCTTASCAWVF